jgi:galactose mutarotase-like enzyme
MFKRMNSIINQTTWHGMHAWALETEHLRTVVVPDMGAKLVSIFDKRNQLEWLVDPGSRPFKKVSYGAAFENQDMSGWDEMFPTIVACKYPAGGKNFGVPLPDHGEVWAMPWEQKPATPGELKLSIAGKALPYRLTRTLGCNEAATLKMFYELNNLSLEPIAYIWAAHPQFTCGEQAEIRLPSQVTEVCNTIPAIWGWGEPETRFGWPQAVSVDGENVRIDRTGPVTLHQARKFFVLPETPIGSAGLVRSPSGDWLRLDWNSAEVPYLGIWVDEGALNHTTVTALEPTTGFYDSLAVAWEKNEVALLEPGATQTWTLTVRVGTGEQPFPAGPEGTS